MYVFENFVLLDRTRRACTTAKRRRVSKISAKWKKPFKIFLCIVYVTVTGKSQPLISGRVAEETQWQALALD